MANHRADIAEEHSWQGLVAAQLQRVRTELHEVLATCTVEGLQGRVRAGANPVGWLAWHLTRSHDRNLSEIAAVPQVWVNASWHETFGRTGDPSDTGFGHTPDDVNRFDPVGADALLGYHDAVIDMALDYLRVAPQDDLARVAPSPTLGTSFTVQRRLVGVLNEGFQHLGQIRVSQPAHE